MVTVNIIYDGENIVGFKAEGHAGYARAGRDIYCAGVSAITGTALIGLQKHLTHPPIYQEKDGWLSCQLPLDIKKEDMANAQIILTTMEAGLRSLQETNPRYIKVIQGGAKYVQD
ncbi:Protein of unknown function DUF464 [Syntrophomonas zehnderi OL-4]|uniref:Ribosomal processing cysteine protease Prp n=1 Tax=Syntrophomonas zehnderi OL-4 TaxID=690567 RepID=A0A0E4GB63_9FIRM|nr:ribosomal-processing cysteine protease Prp [Syntrophomonas zehnderi]CFX80247.1 Protein of unknown function DUF464 [Syntrophomonas zehnderi OL-4]